LEDPDVLKEIDDISLLQNSGFRLSARYTPVESRADPPPLKRRGAGDWEGGSLANVALQRGHEERLIRCLLALKRLQ